MTQTLRIGTRGSPLALTQAGLVRDALCGAYGLDEGAIDIVPIRTTGDRIQDKPLAEIGGKALWTKELDRALLDGEIDCAVHSMKDVETIRPVEIAIAAVLPRADVRDRLIGGDSINALPQGACIGSSSPRRAAQLLNLRPDVTIQSLRGNVATRLKAVENGDIDATLLAAAGLDRLGHPDVGAPLSVELWLPAAQQGAIGIEVLGGRQGVLDQLKAIDEPTTHLCICAERALLETLGADCHSPVAALARQDGDEVTVTAQLFTNSGEQTVWGKTTASSDRAADAARELASSLLNDAPAEIRALFAG